IDATLIGIVERVTRRMRAAGRTGRTVVLRLRYGEFARATRSHTMPRAPAGADATLAVARWVVGGAVASGQRGAMAAHGAPRGGAGWGWGAGRGPTGRS